MPEVERDFLALRPGKKSVLQGIPCIKKGYFADLPGDPENPRLRS
jgi:hypothetical protein